MFSVKSLGAQLDLGNALFWGVELRCTNPGHSMQTW